ncbi:mechanosensitive ion channel family protein [Planosporangium mesophilum]|nr:mechanosensitive ion channel family protein [Planosporangium mesophilum]
MATAVRANAVLAASPSPHPTPSCPQAPVLCGWVFDKTGQAWLAEGSYLFLLKPLRIVLIVALAILARTLIHRTINRLVRTTNGFNGSGSAPALLRPLREKMPATLLRDAVALPERRRQRAEALGSVLRSIASAVIFVITLMLVLSELGLNLAPLLASAGIVGLAVGFGAQNLVKDFVAGMFMLLEDQYGVGDVVDAGQASGTVEAVGLRITTIRDAQGVVWYIRNGEITRVGNKSQGWAQVVVDIPVGFAGVREAAEILRTAAAKLADDPQWSDDLIDPPEVLGVEQITADGAVLRTTVKTTSESQWRVGRELRRCLTDALDRAGIAERLGAGRILLHPAGGAVDQPPPPTATPAGTAGPADTGQHSGESGLGTGSQV